MDNVCGLDASTTTVGACVLDSDGNILVLDYLDLSEIEKDRDGLFNKVQTAIDWIAEKTADYEPRLFGLEDFLKSFAGGRTTASTIISLAQFNGALECSLKSKYGAKSVQKIHVRTARSLAVGKLPKAADRGTKEVYHGRGKEKKMALEKKSEKDWIFEWFCDNVEFDFPKTKTGRHIEQSKDMVDSWIVAMAVLRKSLSPSQPS